MTQDSVTQDGNSPGDSAPRDARGEWQPPNVIKPTPIFIWPPQPVAAAKWLVKYDGYVLPWNAFYVLLATLTWNFATPAMSRMASFQWDWMLEIFLRNLVIFSVFTGLLHFRLYMQKGQGRRFKYNGSWLGKKDSQFLFSNQVLDNVFWSLAGGVTIWSAFEIGMMWGYANNMLPYADWVGNPVWFIAMFFLLPFWRMFHFYCIHRLIHWKPLYDTVHYLHHKNVNIGPWSGMAMHPVEQALYLSTFIIHFVVPSHPLHLLLNLQQTALQAPQGHSGFDEIVVAGDTKIPNHGYFHYLHHRYHTVNFGEGLVPMDRWFGSFHDGSEEAHAAMRKKRK